MGLLHGTKVYLSGPIEFSNDSKNWRKTISEFLNELDVKIYDPLVKPDWFPDLTKADPSSYLNGINKENYDAIDFVRRIDMKYVYDTEWIIAYLPRCFTVGTIEELAAAANMGKPILVVSEDGVPSSWAMAMLSKFEDMSDVFFRNFKDLVDYINKIDNNEISLDPVKWSFITYFNDGVKINDPME